FAECGTPVGQTATLTREVPPAANSQSTLAAGSALSKPPGPVATYSDALPSELQEQHPFQNATYAIEVLNDAGRGAGLSNLVHVPLVPALESPSHFTAQVTA